MEHVVFYPGPDGNPAFRRFTSQEEAVRFVEHLRNVEDVAEVSLHALTPVPVAFRAYYRVEVPAAEVVAFPADVPEQAVPVAVVEPDVAEADTEMGELVPLEPVAVEGEAVANGKRSLGFFSH